MATPSYTRNNTFLPDLYLKTQITSLITPLSLPTKAMGQMNINESVSTEVLVGNPQPTVDVDMEEDFDEVEVKDNFEADGKKEGWSKCRMSLLVVYDIIDFT